MMQKKEEENSNKQKRQCYTWMLHKDQKQHCIMNAVAYKREEVCMQLSNSKDIKRGYDK